MLVLYFLTVPAVEIAAFGRWGLRTSSGATIHMAPLERMAHLYALPYVWLASHESPLSPLLVGYRRWCWMRVKIVKL